MSQEPYDLPVSTKNLEYLSEMMRQENLAGKKCAQYEQLFTDPALKTLCRDLKQHHIQRFDRLYQYLSDQEGMQ